MNDNLDLDNENPSRLICCLDIDTDEFVVLKILVRKGIHEFHRLDRLWQIENGIEQTDQADLISRFAKDLAKRKINPGSNPNFR
jgi:hypothetical protein